MNEILTDSEEIDIEESVSNNSDQEIEELEHEEPIDAGNEDKTISDIFMKFYHFWKNMKKVTLLFPFLNLFLKEDFYWIMWLSCYS